jgi:hypothetical protein
MTAGTLIWLAVAIVVVCIFAIVLKRARRPTFFAGIKPVDPEAPAGSLETCPLAADSRTRYVQAWDALQTRFAEDPEIAIREADNLLQSAMRECGYPTGDFGRITDEVTPEQLDVLEYYRVAHRLSAKGETTVLSDEEIDRAMTALRAVHDILLK